MFGFIAGGGLPRVTPQPTLVLEYTAIPASKNIALGDLGSVPKTLVILHRMNSASDPSANPSASITVDGNDVTIDKEYYTRSYGDGKYVGISRYYLGAYGSADIDFSSSYSYEGVTVWAIPGKIELGDTDSDCCSNNSITVSAGADEVVFLNYTTEGLSGYYGSGVNPVTAPLSDRQSYSWHTGVFLGECGYHLFSESGSETYTTNGDYGPMITVIYKKQGT